MGNPFRTIVLYEKLTFADQLNRTVGSVGYYEKDEIMQFKFALKVKHLGLYLEEIKELAQQYDERTSESGDGHAMRD